MKKVKAVFLALISIFIMSGCNGSDDENGYIKLCNSDSVGYYIEIIRDSDDAVIESFYIDKWYHLIDNCEFIYHIDSEEYYISFENEYTHEITYSETFYLSEGEIEEFVINTNGYIEKY